MNPIQQKKQEIFKLQEQINQLKKDICILEKQALNRKIASLGHKYLNKPFYSNLTALQAIIQLLKLENYHLQIKICYMQNDTIEIKVYHEDTEKWLTL